MKYIINIYDGRVQYLRKDLFWIDEQDEACLFSESEWETIQPENYIFYVSSEELPIILTMLI